MSLGLKCPFTAASQLIVNNDSETNSGHESARGSLPGHPRLSLDAGEQLGTFLEAELCCDDLETMAPHLWVMSTQASNNVRPLHGHRMLGREILVTESPRLHLVWHYDRVFIKPLPRYLLSHGFWETYLLDDTSGASKSNNDGGSSRLSTSDSLLGGVPGRAEKLRRAAMGFVRTYRYLIQHESDLAIAWAVGLVPAEMTWPRFSAFVSRFDDVISDADVSGRYRYGDLRLTRLNFYCMFFLHRTSFEHMPEQYSTYFARFFGPLLFIFAVVSLMLSAMQVEIAVQGTKTDGTLAAAWAIYSWFSVVVVSTALFVSVYLFGQLVYKIVNE
jgi:hypothetical protein